MKRNRAFLKYFSKGEIILLAASVGAIVIAFLVFDRADYMTLAASLIGVTSLVFNAKGNPTGQCLMIVFSLLYGVISYSFAYYGEMITYLGMTAPMAAAALVSWLRHPYEGRRREVEVNDLSRKELVFMWLPTAAVTAGFYFILKALHTANIMPSTLSIATSFAAAYLTWRRSPYYALLYAANDIVLIILWMLAALKNTSYIQVSVCFCAFLANDIYGFVSWRSMAKRQRDRSRDDA